jgi:hypothetical protein
MRYYNLRQLWTWPKITLNINKRLQDELIYNGQKQLNEYISLTRKSYLPHQYIQSTIRLYDCWSQHFLLDLHSLNDNTNFKKLKNALPSKFSLVSALSSLWWKWSWGWKRRTREWRWRGGMKIWIIQRWWNLYMHLKPNGSIHLEQFFLLIHSTLKVSLKGSMKMWISITYARVLWKGCRPLATLILVLDQLPETRI